MLVVAKGNIEVVKVLIKAHLEKLIQKERRAKLVAIISKVNVNLVDFTGFIAGYEKIYREDIKTVLESV